MAGPRGHATLLEGVVARDPDPVVSLAALESLRRLRMRELNGLLNERISLAAGRGDTSQTVAQLAEAQERWVALERGSMLPAFMRTPPLSAKPRCFGSRAGLRRFREWVGRAEDGGPDDRDLSPGAALRLSPSATISTASVESPSDPRWKTWFEDLYGPLGIPSTPRSAITTGAIPTALLRRSSTRA